MINVTTTNNTTNIKSFQSLKFNTNIKNICNKIVPCSLIASNSDNWWDYDYLVSKDGSQISWDCNVEGNWKHVIQNSSNEGNLNSFKDSMDSMISNQDSCYWCCRYWYSWCCSWTVNPGAETVTIGFIVDNYTSWWRYYGSSLFL